MIFSGVLSDFQHRLSGNRCHKQFSSATLSVFKSRLKTSYSLSATEVTTLWRYGNSIIIIIILYSTKIEDMVHFLCLAVFLRFT